jgi:parallel beta-helix repeat protein
MKPWILGLIWAATGTAAEPSPPPRATSGDDRKEPVWTEHLTVRVGNTDGDLRGDSGAAIQGAIDLVARHGGGTVEILPGTYRLRNSIFMASRVRLTGHGAASILIKEPSVTTTIAADSDWYDQEITLTSSQGFQLGDGITLRAPSARFAIKRTLVARTGNRWKLDRPLRDNLWIAEDKATVASLFPLISGEQIDSFVIENLTLDGNRAANGLLDGNYAGCVWLQDCRRGTLRKLDARSFHGDGLSWQICHDMQIEDCWSHDHSGLGLHPGSGSQRSRITGCLLEQNDIGIFFCWGVRGTLAKGNRILNNRVGISMGHRDTNNHVLNNNITGNRDTGLLFRREKDSAAAAHHNLIENNAFTDNGPENGAAITISAPVEGLELKSNRFTDTRTPATRSVLSLAPGAIPPDMSGNSATGFATERKPSP